MPKYFLKSLYLQVFKKKLALLVDVMEQLRWKYAEEFGADDTALRDYWEDQMNNWWIAFYQHHAQLEAELKTGDDAFLSKFMAEHLQSKVVDIAWEFGFDKGTKKYQLVLTPEDDLELRPMIESLIARAPRLENWSFFSYRQPISYPDCEKTVPIKSGEPLLDLQFSGNPAAENNIEISFYYPGIEDDSSLYNLVVNQAFFALEALLGEEVLDKWIGVIEVLELPEDDRQLLPLADLRAYVDTQLTLLKKQLPDHPYYTFSEDSDWMLYELDPSEADDYPKQADLYIARTMNSKLWANIQNGLPFYSENYSRRGETFCYLKMDGNFSDEETFFELKTDIENQLNQALLEAGYGSVIGSGTGYRYQYIDLALHNFKAAVALIQQLTKELGTPRNTWLLFFDTPLSSEWIGIFENTPPPFLG